MGMSSRIQRIKSSRFSQRSKKQLEKGNEELGKTETNEKPIKKGKVVRKSSVTKIETRTQYILNKKNNVQKKRIVNKTKKINYCNSISHVKINKIILLIWLPPKSKENLLLVDY